MSVVARIRVEVEVTVGNWAEESTFATLKGQVKREGVQKLRKAFEGREIRVIGEPTCSFVVFNEKDQP